MTWLVKAIVVCCKNSTADWFIVIVSLILGLLKYSRCLIVFSSSSWGERVATPVFYFRFLFHEITNHKSRTACIKLFGGRIYLRS